MILKKILFCFGCLAIILTLIPFVAADYWWIRMFDFPHVQLTVLTLLAILFYSFRFDIKYKKDYVFMGIMVACFVFQLIKILPYTRLHSYDMLPAQSLHETNDITLFTANVLQKNKQRQKVIEDIKNVNPDIVLLCEVDKNWLDALAPYMNENYNYQKLVPQDNTYGMALYSRLDLIDPTIHYLVDEDVPSIQTKFLLKSKDTIQFYGIHPTPPLPHHNPKSSDRDTEMLLTANMARASKHPVVVLGDFNDVAWSNTTKLFKATSMLLDPRVGRGFFNTFSADSYIMRWPVDHIFASPEFRLRAIDLGADIASDHFPTLIRISYEPTLADQQTPDLPSKEQLHRAAAQIKAFEELHD